MVSKTDNLLFSFIPPIVWDLYQRYVKNNGFFGDYTCWSDACEASTGYDTALILERVKESLLKVRDGEAVFERDSVLFDTVEYSWPLLSGLLWIASQNSNCLNLIDYGGSLGSSYYQNRILLKHLNLLSWNVVEQEGFVECGKEHFEDQHLKFYRTIDDCLELQRADTVLLGSVLQYLEKPYELLDTITDKGISYIIIDRTPFSREGTDRIAVQKVPRDIYPASYPAWIFSYSTFMQSLDEKFDLVAEFDATDRMNYDVMFKGFIYKKRK